MGIQESAPEGLSVIDAWYFKLKKISITAKHATMISVINVLASNDRIHSSIF